MGARRPLLVASAACLLGACTPAPIEVATVDQGALTDGLLAHWPLDENSGAATADTVGGYNGVLQGPGWTWQSGRWGAAVHFSGTDMVTVPSFPKLMRNFSVSAWVYIASNEVGTPIANLVSTEISGGGWALYAQLIPGSEYYSFEYAVTPTQGMATPGLIIAQCACVQTDTWVHLTAVMDSDGGTLIVYADSPAGSFQSPPMPATAAMLPGSAMLEIGHSTRTELGSAFPVTGAIDDVAIYNRVLEQHEITQLDTAPVPDPRH
jgi:hypothetical protein